MTSCEGRAVIRVTGEVDVDRSGMLRGSLDSLLRIVTDEDFSGPRGESRRRDLQGRVRFAGGREVRNRAGGGANC